MAKEPKEKKSIFKRWWFWVIVVILVFGIIGNSGGDDKPDEKGTPETDLASSDVKTKALMSVEVKTADVMNGFKTEKVGERAYIEVSKDALKSVTPEEFLEFTKSKVDGSGYNWWSIVCDDGTGIVFTGSMSLLSEYGKLDSDGRIEELKGNITALSDKGTVEYEEVAQEAPAPVPASDTPTEEVSLDDLRETIEQVLSAGFDDYKVEAEDEFITVYIFYDGITEELALIQAAGGNADSPQWVELKNNFLSLSESIQNLIDASGREDVVLSLNLMNDVNRDNVLLTLLDSAVFYDALA